MTVFDGHVSTPLVTCQLVCHVPHFLHRKAKSGKIWFYDFYVCNFIINV